MTHLRDTVAEFCEQLRKEGFQGIQFGVAEVLDSAELEDFDGNETQFNEWQRDYVNFVVIPETESQQFWADFLQFLRSIVGSDVVVSHAYCGEFKCFRRDEDE